MSRRVNRIPVVLDTGNVKELSPEWYYVKKKYQSN